MRILFTGASSFTGMWFVQALAEQGHEIITLFRRSQDDYQALRKTRLERVLPCSDPRFDVPYSSPAFFDLIAHEKFDMFCHHAAEVTDYKNPEFDYISALKNNVGDISSILKILKSRGCERILLTGSVFEPNEGSGSSRAVSTYGLSKGLTWEAFQFFSEIHQMTLKKFVIPNPFGPFEEFRFTSFLMKNWLEKEPVHVTMPAYVRDNIHVSLLAKAYADFAVSQAKKLNPSGYRESQGEFTIRFAENIRKRLNLPCEFTLANQLEFPEPRERVNTDTLNLNWNEEEAWNELAEYYEGAFAR